MSPWNMKNSVKKIEHFGNDKIILTERELFGYNMLINDMRSLAIMRETGYPICLMLLTQYNNQLQWEIYLAVKENLFLI